MKHDPEFILLAALLAAVATVNPGGSSFAQGSGDGDILTLRAAMASARSNALEVRAASARADSSEARLRQARAYRMPLIRLQEIWTRTDSPAEAFGLVLNQERFSLADFGAGDPNNPDPVDNALTRFEVELPIYTGGEIAGRVRQATHAVAAGHDAAAWAEDQAALGAAEAYVGLAMVRERVKLLERTLETVEAHVRVAGAYVDQGLVVRSELLRAQVELAGISDLLTEARGQARTALENLAFRLGAAGVRDWVLEPVPEPDEVGAPVDDWLASAEARRDLEAARRQVEAIRLEERVERAGLRPKIGLLARHDLYDESLFGAGGDSTAIVAVASIELFAGGRHRAAAAAARFDADAATLDVERFREGIRLEVRDAYERAATARERQATARTALGAARETERITRERFANGVAKTVDVLDAVTARRDAETRELVARSEAQLATLRLALAAGRRPESGLSPAFTRQTKDEPTADDRDDDRTLRRADEVDEDD